MSRENVEVVRKIYEAVARRDSKAVLSLYDPEVGVDGSRLPEARMGGSDRVHGYEGIRSFHQAWSDAWENFEDRCDELIDAGDYVISVVTRRARGRASGVETTLERAGVWTIREERVVRVVWFPSRQEALEAVGLRE